MIRRTMIDIETLGTKPGGIVLEIGIVCNVSNPYDANGNGADWTMGVHVDIAQQPDALIDPATLRWWMRHPVAFDRLTKAQLTGQAVAPAAAIDSMAVMLRGVDEVWGNSPSFDCAILVDFVDRYAGAVPWRYVQERDFRTARSLRPDVPYVPPAEAHGALADALAQAAHLDKLGIWRS
jgi:hypothetical protein